MLSFFLQYLHDAIILPSPSVIPPHVPFPYLSLARLLVLSVSKDESVSPLTWLLSLTKMYSSWGSVQFSSVHFSRSVVSDSLQPHESQHARAPCSPPTPGVHSNSRPLSRWCHPGISSSDVPFSSCSQSLPASESFPMSQLFVWGGQSTKCLVT